MLVKTLGVVIKTKKLIDGQVLLWILTKDYGVIRVFAREKNSCSFVSTELFCFSDFILLESKDVFKLYSAETKEPFLEIRTDLSSLSLASYLCQLIYTAVLHQLEDFSDVIELLYFALKMISKAQNLLQIKSVFELKFACLLGFTPGEKHKEGIEDESEIFAAVCFIIESKVKRCFSFKLLESKFLKLTKFTEDYLIGKIERRPQTLDYFWDVYLEKVKGCEI